MCSIISFIYFYFYSPLGLAWVKYFSNWENKRDKLTDTSPFLFHEFFKGAMEPFGFTPFFFGLLAFSPCFSSLAPDASSTKAEGFLILTWACLCVFGLLGYMEIQRHIELLKEVIGAQDWWVNSVPFLENKACALLSCLHWQNVPLNVSCYSTLHLCFPICRMEIRFAPFYLTRSVSSDTAVKFLI